MKVWPHEHWPFGSLLVFLKEHTPESLVDSLATAGPLGWLRSGSIFQMAW